MLNAAVPLSHHKYLWIILIGMVAVISSALAFEHVGGYVPCKLCLQQRVPWYAGIGMMTGAVIFLRLEWSDRFARGLVLVAGLLMLYSLYLGVHHAGVEWGYWEGPSDCGAVSGGLADNTEDFLKQLNQTVGPSCTEASLRVLGLSFAGWNAVASLVLALFAFWTALSGRKTS